MSASNNPSTLTRWHLAGLVGLALCCGTARGEADGPPSPAKELPVPTLPALPESNAPVPAATTANGVSAAQNLPNENSPVPSDDRLSNDSGFIENLSDAPLTLQFRRAWGTAWSDSYTLPPGQRLEINRRLAPDWYGLGEHVVPQFVVVRYPALHGILRTRLSARSSYDTVARLPYFYYMIDSSGVGRMINASNIERARQIQGQLLAQPARSEQEMRQYRDQLTRAGMWRPTPEPDRVARSVVVEGNTAEPSRAETAWDSTWEGAWAGRGATFPGRFGR